MERVGVVYFAAERPQGEDGCAREREKRKKTVQLVCLSKNMRMS